MHVVTLLLKCAIGPLSYMVTQLFTTDGAPFAVELKQRISHCHRVIHTRTYLIRLELAILWDTNIDNLGESTLRSSAARV